MTATSGSRRVAVLGGGSWGTALARHAALNGVEVRLWVHSEPLALRISASRENDRYLPGFPLPAGVTVTSSLAEACAGARTLLLAVPSRHCREVLQGARDHIAPGARVISASKGIEQVTLLRVSEVIEGVLGRERISDVAALSGPSFAREVASGRPTAIVAAGSLRAAEEAQRLVAGRNLRIYTSPDLVGVEVGGALKNVVAIAAGVVAGLELGPNTMAALITRGLAEITRLACSLGAQGATLSGLAGVGDLILTCTGAQSRNFQVGLLLGRGRRLPEILGGMTMVAEGVDTARSVGDLGRRHRVSMPISEQVGRVLFESMPPEEAIRELLDRPQRPEQD